MSELMLINPGRRVKKRAKTRRKMSPLQLKYFGKKSQRTTVMAKKRRTKKRRHNPVTALAANPKRRHRRLSAKRRHNPIRSRRRRHNPLSLGHFSLNGFMKQTLMPSAIGAAGALGLDMILAHLPIPDALKTTTMKPVVRIAGAVALGMIAGAVTNRRTAEQMTAGAVTVILYDTIKSFMMTNVPAVAPALAGLGDAYDYETLGYSGAGQGVGAYVDGGMGAYVDGGVGEYFNNKVSTM